MGERLMMRPRNERGVTLVETLLALVLLGVGVLSVAPLFVYASRGTAAGADLGEVGALAVEQLETLRDTPYSVLADGGSLSSNTTGYFDDTTPGYLVRWQIAANAATPNSKVITLRALSLRPSMGASREITLMTLRGK